jgi:hypothetical protein
MTSKGTIKLAKLQYRTKIESYYTSSDAHRNLLQTTKGSTAESCPVTRAYQMSKITCFLALRKVTLKDA